MSFLKSLLCGPIPQDLLVSGCIFDAVAELTLVALAAGHRDVWEEVQNFAGRWRRCAGRLEAVVSSGRAGLWVESRCVRGV